MKATMKGWLIVAFPKLKRVGNPFPEAAGNAPGGRVREPAVGSWRSG